MKKLSALMLSVALCFTSVPAFANEVVADEEESATVYTAYNDYAGWMYNSTVTDNTVFSVPCKGLINFSYWDLGFGGSNTINVRNSDGKLVAALTTNTNSANEYGLWKQSIAVTKGEYYLENSDGYSMSASFTPSENYTGWQFNGYDRLHYAEPCTEAEIWYFYKDGKLVENWQYIGGSWYWFYPEGTFANPGMTTLASTDWSYVMATDTWVTDGGVYYVLKNGKMAKNCWIYIMGDDGNYHWFYMKNNGSKLTSSWQYSKGKWYWLKENGEMASNEWIEQDGKWYYVRSNGAMAANETICGNKFDSHGVWLGKE